MWKDYSISFVRRNRASSVSVMAAAFIAALLLSVLCSFFYDSWMYDVESIILEEGDWQGRVIGALNDEGLDFVRNFANVERVAVNEGYEDGDELTTVYDIYFQHPRRIYQDMTTLSEKLDLEPNRITYHYELLAMSFIRIPGDEAPRLLFPFYCMIVGIVCISLILVIHNSFAVSMNARVHQLGILSGIGATPGQIRTCLMQEAAMLCAIPILLGSLAGTLVSRGMIRVMEIMAAQMAGRHTAAFHANLRLYVLTVLVAAVTVLLSAWIPARRLAGLSPLEAIRGAEEMQLKRRKHSPVLSRIFGVEGELAGNALRAQRKSLRTSTISLTFAFFAFTIMLCFFRLSGISTNYTYFKRYQNVWDVMATVKEARIEDFGLMGVLREEEQSLGAASCIAYQKALATVRVPASEISSELTALGGLENVAGISACTEHEQLPEYCIDAPLMILDDEGFLEYCEQVGIAPGLDGAIVLNRIWDSVNSNFRYRQYIPYVKENLISMVLQNDMQDRENTQTIDEITVPILGYTQDEPILREEYADYALVYVMPAALWRDIRASVTNNEPDVYIRILADRAYGQSENSDKKTDVTIAHLNAMEETLAQIIGQQYETETENRVQEKLTNDRLILGYELILAMFCILLAVVGIANVFCYAMGFLRQRRREFARYLSIGMTPADLKKMFYIEILVIAGRPVLITLPIVVLVIELMINASYLNPAEFWTQAPLLPIAVFIAAIFGFVALAYYLGGRRILRDDLVEALRSDAAGF